MRCPSLRSMKCMSVVCLLLVSVGCRDREILSWEEMNMRSARMWTLPDGTQLKAKTVSENDHVVLLECGRLYSRFSGNVLLRVSQLQEDDRRFLKKLRASNAPGPTKGVLPGDDPKVAATDREATISLCQISLALTNYHLAHRAHPRQAISADEGKPLLSWRVELLPFLGESKLYDEFRLDEPWDSEHNRELIAKIPPVYSGGKKEPAGGTTRFLAPVGEHTFWKDGGGITRKAVQDGLARTIVVVRSSPDRAVPWTKPVDLDMDLAPRLAELGGPESKGFYGAFGDGRVVFLPKEFSEQNMQAYFTTSKHEVVPTLGAPLPRLPSRVGP